MSKKVVVLNSAVQELTALLAATSNDPVKNAKVLAKSFGIDRQIAKFINKPEPSGLVILIDSKKRAAMWEDIQKAGALTDVNRKRALCISVIQGDVDQHIIEVHKKLTRNNTVALSDDQKNDLASALNKYRVAVIKQILPAMDQLAVELGVAEVENVVDVKEAEAIAPALAPAN